MANDGCTPVGRSRSGTYSNKKCSTPTKYCYSDTCYNKGDLCTALETAGWYEEDIEDVYGDINCSGDASIHGKSWSSTHALSLSDISSEGTEIDPPCTEDGYNEDCVAGTSDTLRYCYSGDGKCYSKTNYIKIQAKEARTSEEIVETTMSSAALLAIEEAALAAAAADRAAEDEESAINAIFYKDKSNYIDDDGFYISPAFWDYSNSDIADNISTGEVGILSVSFTESLYDNDIVLYYTVSDSDSPTFSGNSTKLTVTYDSDEQTALNEKFGFSDDSSIETVINNTVDSLVLQLISSTTKASRSFKKVKYRTFDNDNLSSFEEEEAAQGVSVSTSFVSGAM
jgi:hypothetical protein